MGAGEERKWGKKRTSCDGYFLGPAREEAYVLRSMASQPKGAGTIASKFLGPLHMSTQSNQISHGD